MPREYEVTPNIEEIFSTISLHFLPKANRNGDMDFGVPRRKLLFSAIGQSGTLRYSLGVIERM